MLASRNLQLNLFPAADLSPEQEIYEALDSGRSGLLFEVRIQDRGPWTERWNRFSGNRRNRRGGSREGECRRRLDAESVLVPRQPR